MRTKQWGRRGLIRFDESVASLSNLTPTEKAFNKRCNKGLPNNTFENYDLRTLKRGLVATKSASMGHKDLSRGKTPSLKALTKKGQKTFVKRYTTHVKWNLQVKGRDQDCLSSRIPFVQDEGLCTDKLFS